MPLGLTHRKFDFHQRSRLAYLLRISEKTDNLSLYNINRFDFATEPHLFAI